MLALDFEKGGRRSGVGTGLLDGNACMRSVTVLRNDQPILSVNSVVDERVAQFESGRDTGAWHIESPARNISQSLRRH